MLERSSRCFEPADRSAEPSGIEGLSDEDSRRSTCLGRLSSGWRLLTLMRPAVMQSWQRSIQHKIAVTRPETTVVTDADFYRRRQQHRTFLHAVRPAMEKAREFLAGANSMAILSDPTGTVLETVGDARAMDLGSSVKLQRGGCWSEAEIGTNAIGTAIADMAPVQIHAVEHFCSEVQKWTCAAAPVRHPSSDEILGAIDISGPAGDFNPQSLAHAVAMAHQIEGLVGRRIDAEHDRVLHHFLDKRALSLAEEVVAFGRSGALIIAPRRRAAKSSGASRACSPVADWLFLEISNPRFGRRTSRRCCKE